MLLYWAFQIRLRLYLVSRVYENFDGGFLGNNCHMVVNIKSARLLSPKNSLQRQLRFAAVDPHAITEARVPRLEYHQIFQSPWCCDADVEEQYHSMMESIFHLDMDEACCTLLVLAAMFDISGTTMQLI